MPEPLSIATATIGTTLGVLGFLVGTLNGLNKTKRSVMDFPERFQVLVSSLEACKGDLDGLDKSWGYDGGDEDLFRHVCGAQFKKIREERQNVHRYAEKVQQYVTESFNITPDEVRAWTAEPTTSRGRLWFLKLRLRFAVFSEDTLRAKVGDLETAVKNLSNLYDKRQKALFRDNTRATVPPKHVVQLIALDALGKELWQMRTMRAARDYSQWTLELWPLGWDGSTDLSGWTTSGITRVQLWLSFHVRAAANGRAARDRRLNVDYSVDRHVNPAAWVELITREPAPEVNADDNPRMRSCDILASRTKPFRSLFAQDDFFLQRPVYMLWQKDLSHLLVALTTWSALLWHTNWTSNICPSGIRFVRHSLPNAAAEGPCLHTLSQRRDHEPGAGQVEDGFRVLNEYDTCNHGDPQRKLRNLGLTIAELICANPFRVSQTDDFQYEQWNGNSKSWETVSVNQILGTIQSKSGSVSIRETVQFCLTSDLEQNKTNPDDPWDGHGMFLNEYIKRVIEPLQNWAQRIQDPKNYPGALHNVQGLKRWPEDAFEAPTDPLPEQYKLQLRLQFSFHKWTRNGGTFASIGAMAFFVLLVSWWFRI